jgi:hypothetical protein
MNSLVTLLTLMSQTPSRTESPLNVSFTVAPLLGAPKQAPTLEVVVSNTANHALDVMRFESDPCFAQFQLALTLTLPDGKKALAASCPIRSWPGSKGTLAAGASETRTLDLAKVFPSVTWAAGRYGVEVAWEPQALESYFAGQYVWHASQWSLDGETFVLARPLGHVRVAKGKTVTLPGGGQLTFIAHGHKRTHPGQTSPLMLEGALDGKEFGVSIGGSHRFAVEGQTFVLTTHSYDEWMELDCFGRL